MPANVRYRCTYYNTTGSVDGDYVSWKLEILDTEAVSGVITFQSTTPTEDFEGISTTFEPGIYTSSLKFGIYLRTTPKTIQGKTFGLTADLWVDILTAAEGRFLVRYYKNDVLQFVGPIIYDQCSKTDEDIPLMNITAIDGLARLKTTDYVSQIGQIKYYNKKGIINPYDTSPLLYDGPTTGLTIPVIEHTVRPLHGLTDYFIVETTWAYREMFSITSPGSGWVSQGEGRWAKAVAYSNEQELETPGVNYKLTRDIDDEKHRTVAEYIQRALVETKMSDEYSGVMYDCTCVWKEHSMGDLAADTFLQMRLPEDPMLDKTWEAGMQEICRLLYLRIYYSNGRYHIEQISSRDDTTFTRYIYNADGTSAGASETASLDLDLPALSIKPGVGGVYKILPPLRSVECKITLDNSNLMDGVDWHPGEYGERYLGRIKQVDGDQKLYIELHAAITSSFDPVTLLLFPGDFINVVCEHVITVYYVVRLTNINTATTYWLDQGAGLAYAGTWDTNFEELHFAGTRFGQPTRRYSYENFGYTVDRIFNTIAETLPGSTGDMYDIHVSIRTEVAFETPTGVFFWTTVFPDKFYSTINTGGNILKLYSTAAGNLDAAEWVEADGGAERIYVAPNDVANSLEISTELQWADTGQHQKSIEIYDGTNWKRSSEWSIGGIGTPVPILQLLAAEIMSLRTVPKNIYSGSFLTSLPNAENRLKRGSDYYLPLSCSKNTDVDTFSGEFVQILRVTPPGVEVIANDVLNDPMPTPGNDGNADPPSEATVYFETNEVITAGSTLTEVDIVNTLGIYIANGETVTIINAATGQSENVTLTQEILPADTVMHFESNLMTYSYPDASAILLLDAGVTIESGGAKYRYNNRIYNGATHTIPVGILDLTPLDGLSNQHINNKVYVWKNGTKLIAFDFETAGVASSLDWWYDSGTNQIKVHPDFEYVNEYLGIDIDLTR